jgi:hypothetical protein
MTLLIEHVIILLAEEVCGSWRLPGYMGSQIHNHIFLDFFLSYLHIVCVISLRGLQKGEHSHARVRMSARRSLG